MERAGALMDARQGDACGSPLFSWICSEPSTTGAIDRGGRAHYTQPARRSIAGQVLQKVSGVYATAVLTRQGGAGSPAPSPRFPAASVERERQTEPRKRTNEGQSTMEKKKLFVSCSDFISFRRSSYHTVSVLILISDAVARLAHHGRTARREIYVRTHGKGNAQVTAALVLRKALTAQSVQPERGKKKEKERKDK